MKLKKKDYLKYGVLIVASFIVIAYLLGGFDKKLIDIDDSKNSTIGMTFMSNGQPYLGASYLSSDGTTAGGMYFSSAEPWSKLCAGKKLYFTYYATPTQTDNVFAPEMEKTLYDNYLSKGTICSIKYIQDNLYEGDYVDLYQTAQMGAKVYTAGQQYICANGCTAGHHSIKAKVKCGTSGIVYPDEVGFDVITCTGGGGPDPIVECDKKDTSYCQGGYLYVEDWRYSSGTCSRQTIIENNAACDLEYQEARCAAKGMKYWPPTKQCINVPDGGSSSSSSSSGSSSSGSSSGGSSSSSSSGGGGELNNDTLLIIGAVIFAMSIIMMTAIILKK